MKRLQGRAIALTILMVMSVLAVGMPLSVGQTATEEDGSKCYVIATDQNVLNQVNLSTGEEIEVGNTGVLGVIDAMSFQPGTNTLFGSNEDQLGVINVSNGNFAPRPNTYGTAEGAVGDVEIDDVRAMAFDATSGHLYAVHRRAGRDILFRIDPVTGQHVANAFGAGTDYVVVDTPAGIPDIEDLTSDNQGRLYGIANAGTTNDELVIINASDGSVQTVGPTVSNMEGLTFSEDGNLYGTTGHSGGAASGDSLYRINQTTGTATKIATLSGDDYESIACTRTPAQQADLGVQKTVNTSSVIVGNEVEYQITVTNHGTQNATGVTIADNVSRQNITLVSATTTQGTYANGVWDVGSIPVGETEELTLTARINDEGSYVNLAEITSADQSDPITTNNSDTAQVTAGERADLAIAKSVNDSSVIIGDDVRFSLQVTNNGPNPATDVVVYDRFPSCGLTQTSHTASQGSYTPSTGLWSIGSLGVGDTATLDIIANATKNGSFDNTASINQTDQPDPAPGNNNDSASVTVSEPGTPGCTVGITVGSGDGGGTVVVEGSGGGETDGTTAGEMSLVADAPESARAGEQASITYMLTNSGSTTAQSGSITIDQLPNATLQQISSPELDASWSLPARTVSFSAGLDPGQSKNATFVLNLSSTLQPGDELSIPTTGTIVVNGSAIQGSVAVPIPIEARPGYVGESTALPQDLDDDGLYEDLNGDGTVNAQDVLLLWNNRESLETQFFDFTGDGVVDARDALWLWNNSE